MSHWLDPVWRRLGSRIQPHILPRYAVDIRDCHLFADENNPAIHVEKDATHVSVISCSVTTRGAGSSDD